MKQHYWPNQGFPGDPALHRVVWTEQGNNEYSVYNKRMWRGKAGSAQSSEW